MLSHQNGSFLKKYLFFLIHPTPFPLPQTLYMPFIIISEGFPTLHHQIEAAQPRDFSSPEVSN